MGMEICLSLSGLQAATSRRERKEHIISEADTHTRQGCDQCLVAPEDTEPGGKGWWLEEGKLLCGRGLHAGTLACTGRFLRVLRGWPLSRTFCLTTACPSSQVTGWWPGWHLPSQRQPRAHERGQSLPQLKQ